MIPLGDLALVGRPPAKLVKALALIAKFMHPAFEADPDVAPGISRRSCILVSLTVRDFLWRIGFPDARCVPCAIVVRGFEGEREFHSAGAVPFAEGEGWPGHVVCLVQGFLIDGTVYQLQRPVWPELPGMIAAPANGFPEYELKGELTSPDTPERRIEVQWIPTRDNSWKQAPDARRERRKPALKALVEKMQGWRG